MDLCNNLQYLYIKKKINNGIDTYSTIVNNNIEQFNSLLNSITYDRAEISEIISACIEYRRYEHLKAILIRISSNTVPRNYNNSRDYNTENIAFTDFICEIIAMRDLEMLNIMLCHTSRNLMNSAELMKLAELIHRMTDNLNSVDISRADFEIEKRDFNAVILRVLSDTVILESIVKCNDCPPYIQSLIVSQNLC